jgi:hypothetical protein
MRSLCVHMSSKDGQFWAQTNGQTNVSLGMAFFAASIEWTNYSSPFSSGMAKGSRFLSIKCIACFLRFFSYRGAIADFLHHSVILSSSKCFHRWTHIPFAFLTMSSVQPHSPSGGEATDT